MGFYRNSFSLACRTRSWPARRTERYGRVSAQGCAAQWSRLGSAPDSTRRTTAGEVAKEFPTAPRDSFLIANAAYVSRQTGDPSIGAFLIDTGSSSPAAVARHVRAKLGTAATVTDIQTSRRIVGSSLTAVDLAGLTRVELGFALVLAAASTGLVLWLGLAERRRTFAIATSLGARARHLGGFVWSEAGFVLVVGSLLGAIGAVALSQMLVKVLTGVFDPPPAALNVPWAYLGTVFAVAVAATVVAGSSAIRATRRPALELLRDL